MLLEPLEGVPSRAIKYAGLGMIALFVLSVGYWQDLKEQGLLLENAEATQSELEVLLSKKQKRGHPQSKEDDVFLVPMTVKASLPLLIESLSHQSTLLGLTVDALRLFPPKEMDFYKEYPIEITLSGTYPQLYEWLFFLTTQATLVTLEDFAIQGTKEHKLFMSVYLKLYEYRTKEGQHFLINTRVPRTRAKKTLLRDPFRPLTEMQEKVGTLRSADGRKKWTLIRDPLKGTVYSVSEE